MRWEGREMSSYSMPVGVHGPEPASRPPWEETPGGTPRPSRWPDFERAYFHSGVLIVVSHFVLIGPGPLP